MCGIVGYAGTGSAKEAVLSGLKSLEYRGYDSAGIALVRAGELLVKKEAGKLAALEAETGAADFDANLGIGHTRWATHGAPTRENAHPHVSFDGRIAIVHNGIIENYAELKAELSETHGIKFVSETDSEVIAHLIAVYFEGDLAAAVRAAAKRMKGAYAVAAVCSEDAERIVALRKDAPLVAGVCKEGGLLASDIPALLKYTRDIYLIENDEIVIVSKNDVQIFDEELTRLYREKTHVDWDAGTAEKGGYEHFMLKEIFEQPKTLRDCMRGRIDVTGKHVVLAGIVDHKEKFLNARRIIILACGTSWHAGLVGKYLFESFCKIPVEVEYSSEFRYRNPVIYRDDIVIAISQSGETADTLAAIDLARKSGAFIYGICNVVGSSIARNTDSGSYTHVGPEIGVASTKAFTAQLAVLSMMALCIGKEKGTIEEKQYFNLLKELSLIPEKIEKILDSNDNIKNLSKIFTYAHNFIYLGRGFNYPIALEGALKLKEISYIHAEGYPAAEMKHGPIALIDIEMPVVAIATDNGMYEKVISNIQEIKARNGRVIAVVNENDSEVKRIADYVLEVPETADCFEPLLNIIPLQLLSYHIAVNKRRDVDMPRNLAKSVTVE